MGSELRAKVISSIELNLVGFTDYAITTHCRCTVLPADRLLQSGYRVSDSVAYSDSVRAAFATSDGYACADNHAGVG